MADAHGRTVGRVECPMYGTSPEEPDALSVRASEHDVAVMSSSSPFLRRTLTGLLVVGLAFAGIPVRFRNQNTNFRTL